MSKIESQLELIRNLVMELDEVLVDNEGYAISFNFDDLKIFRELEETLGNLAEVELFDSLVEKINPELGKFPSGFFDNPLTLTQSDLGGLPAELVEQLSDLDELESEILKLMEMGKGTLVLDKIVAGLYHLTGKTHQRNQLTAKLYRMMKKNLIWSVPKKKGVYTTKKDEYEL